MSFFDVLLAKQLAGGGGGGGGDSDFSTATVTILNETTWPIDFYGPAIRKGVLWPHIGPLAESIELTIVNYVGGTIVEIVDNNSRTITVSGNIEPIGGNNFYITGDGTITIT